MCNKISNILANRRTLVGFFTSLRSNAIPDLLKRPENALGHFCLVRACQLVPHKNGLHAYCAINIKRTHKKQVERNMILILSIYVNYMKEKQTQ